jgi:hypothetical protein
VPHREAGARLGPVARAWRLVLVGALAAAFLSGSLVGDDHWWPFGPWRMFATSTAPTGAVTVSALQVTTADRDDWQDVPLNPWRVGLNRAEVEGRHDAVVADPTILGTLAEANARLRPDDERWTGVRLVRRSTLIENRAPTGETRQRVVAEWTAAGGPKVVDP